MTLKFRIVICLLMAVHGFAIAQTTFENARFKFRAAVPDNWTLHREINSESLNYTIVAWGLPKVYSEREKQEIEHSVSITAVNNPGVRNVDDLVQAEFRRIKNMPNSKVLNQVQLDSVEHTSYITNTLIGMVSYVTQQYFLFKDGVGYIVNFTATVETFSVDPPRNTSLLQF